MTRPRWKKPEARAQILALADTVAEAFGVDRPAPFEDGAAREWEFRLDVPRVWTVCGPARLAVDISATFAHLFFRFEDVARAVDSLHYAAHRLNRHSGKWNFWEAAPTPLVTFGQEVTASLYAVADPNPDAAEVEAFEKAEAERAAMWAQYRAEFAASCAARSEGVTA